MLTHKRVRPAWLQQRGSSAMNWQSVCLRCMAIAAALWTAALVYARQAVTETPPRAGQSSQTLADVVEQVKGSVFTLKVYGSLSEEVVGTGTAWALSSSRLVTNWHVVRGAGKVVAVASDGTEHLMPRLVSFDAEVDLAVVEGGSGFQATPLTLASHRPRLGEAVFVLGSPRGLEQSLSDGIVSGIRTFGEIEVLQITAAISPGSSGSPVCSSDGQVLGVATFSIVDGQGLNFAIPVGRIPKNEPGGGRAFPLDESGITSEPAWIADEEIESVYDAFVTDFFARPRYLHNINFYGSDRKCGHLGESVRVFQVLGPSQALVEVGTHSTLIRLSGLRFTMIADGTYIGVRDFVCAQIATYRYETVNGGSNTVPDVVVLDVKLWQQAVARRRARIDSDIRQREAEQARISGRIAALESEVEALKDSRVGRAVELQEKIRLYRPAEHQPEIFQMTRAWRRELEGLGHIEATDIVQFQSRKRALADELDAARDRVLELRNETRTLKDSR